MLTLKSIVPTLSISDWAGVTLVRDGVYVVELNGLRRCVCFPQSFSTLCLPAEKDSQALPKCCGNFCCSLLLNDV